MKVLLAGASGLIGTRLKGWLAAEGHVVRTLVRRAPRHSGEYEWQPAEGEAPAGAFEWAHAVIGLSGASLMRLPWTAGTRRVILESRVKATETLARAIARADGPPRVWLNASATGIYGNRPGEVLTEESARGEGFLADVVARWEQATRAAAGVARVVHLRTGMVLAEDGALRPLVAATRAGVRVTLGTGRQHWPWIGIEDVIRAIGHLTADSDLAGPVNLVGPQPATSAAITNELARFLEPTLRLRVPAGFLKLVLGAAAEDLLLCDQLVRPASLLADGFEFIRATRTPAIAHALGRRLCDAGGQ